MTYTNGTSGHHHPENEDIQTAPANIEAERAVLGACLIDPVAAERLATLLDPGEFYRERHQWIAEAVTNLVRTGIAVDFVTLSDELERAGRLDGIGGPAYLAEIINSTPSAVYMDHYARIVRRTSFNRNRIAYAQAVAELAYMDLPEEQMYARHRELEKKYLAPKSLRSGDMVTLPQSLEDTYDLIGSYSQRANKKEPAFWPWPSFQNAIGEPFRGVIQQVVGDDGTGKCLAKGTKVVMYDGTLRAVEDVRVGDLLMGPDSRPRRVRALGRGQEQMYWVRQKSGIDYRVNESHILALDLRYRKKDAGKTTWFKRKVEMTVKEVSDLPRWHVRRNLNGYKVDIEFPAQPVPVDPYLLGVWLGDGKTESSALYLSDQEIINWSVEHARKIGVGVSQRADNERGTCTAVRLTNGHKHGGQSLTATLRRHGLLGNKHIPQAYLSNTTEVRLQLLAGLLDTDGSLGCGGYEITQKNEYLARQIKFLADSLGFRTNIAEKVATIKERGYSCLVWRVHIYGDVDRIPLKVKRKQAPPRRINKDWRATGIEIEKDVVDDYYGFNLDGDGLFLLEDMTVTHNTALLECVADYLTGERGYKGAFIIMDMTKEMMELRRTSRHTGITLDRLRAGNPTDEEIYRINAATEKLNGWGDKIDYIYAHGYHVDQVVQVIEYLRTARGVDYIIIDNMRNLADTASPRQMMMRMNDNRIISDNITQIAAAIGKKGPEGASDENGVWCFVINQLRKSGKEILSPSMMSKNDVEGSANQTNVVRYQYNLWRGDATADEWAEDANGRPVRIAKQGDRSRFLHVKATKVTAGREFTCRLRTELEFSRMSEPAAFDDEDLDEPSPSGRRK